MIAVDWTALGLGAVAGILMSVVFFVGLALGMQRALRVDNTVRILALSAALRIAAVLAVGWLVMTQAGPWAFTGYGIAFFVCRHIATTMAHVPTPAEGAK